MSGIFGLVKDCIKRRKLPRFIHGNDGKDGQDKVPVMQACCYRTD